MVFSSAFFLFLFLPLALGVYYVAPKSLRNAALLAVSLFFYAWGEKGYVLLMIASIAMNYGLGRWLEARRGRSGERLLLAGAIALNLLLLIHFKYTNFLVSNLNDALASLHLRPIHWRPVHLPIGISFFTFEAIAYLMDVRRGQTVAQRNIVNFGLFMTLFPHLIAGPVVRYRDLADAIEGRNASSEKFASGIRRFLIGLGKKVLIANTLGMTADELFQTAPGELAASAAWLGAICYALHIYFDFSGYSDMAIGLGRMFGFELCENFRYPYIADSVTDFWRRWHISLSTWFRDYLYIPLGGNRRGQVRTAVNLFAVFVLCGLWHGASWTFLAWGLFHGLFLSLERAGLGKLLERVPPALRHLYALLAILAGWVLFRAETIGQAMDYLAAMAGLTHGTRVMNYYLNMELALAIVAGVICSMPVMELVRRFRNAMALRGRYALVSFELAAMGVLIAESIACTARLAAGTYNPFIYFRF
jgi:alginate O-acetyltransferase complex protein AlgI